jgi:hypothetical protein
MPAPSTKIPKEPPYKPNYEPKLIPQPYTGIILLYDKN